MNESKKFPGGSKTRVNTAGNNVRLGKATDEDLQVIDDWRAAHRSVLNTFQAILRNKTKKIKKTKITVAQRHKRKRTIFDKLHRLSSMALSRMDDVAGCRLIFQTIDDLNTFRKNFHQANFNHKRRNLDDKYDYIKLPKPTGYRGIHDIYEYDVKSKVGQNLAGLYVEIQYRTLVQHAWATAVEVIGFVTESQPKFQQGDDRYLNAMVYASEILARAHENTTGPLPELSNQDLTSKFYALDSELNLLNTLRSLNAADKSVTQKKNVILIFKPSGILDITSYRDATEALLALFHLEKKYPDYDIVLVKADTIKEVQLAFKNYFSDAKDFIRLVQKGCMLLNKLN